MATKLDKTIKRELELEGKLYTVAISPEGVKVTPKGARKGHEVSWSTLVGGDAVVEQATEQRLSRTLELRADGSHPGHNHLLCDRSSVTYATDLRAARAEDRSPSR